jgi:hypothetical protein
MSASQPHYPRRPEERQRHSYEESGRCAARGDYGLRPGALRSQSGYKRRLARIHGARALRRCAHHSGFGHLRPRRDQRVSPACRDTRPGGSSKRRAVGPRAGLRLPHHRVVARRLQGLVRDDQSYCVRTGHIPEHRDRRLREHAVGAHRRSTELGGREGRRLRAALSERPRNLH